MHGYLLINKPVGVSSHDCVMHVRKFLDKKIKVGHAGTLDPFASGLLIIAIGREATKNLSYFMNMNKVYVATGKLGELTDTLDCTGEIVESNDVIVSEDDMRMTLKSFGSRYEQIPPLYSALKHEGVPLYKLASQKKLSDGALQKIAEGKQRIVDLYELELVSFEYPYFTIKACVSQGTYVRSLVNDSAVRAGSCATTYVLDRSAIGEFTVHQAVAIDQIKSLEDVRNRLFLVDLR